MKSRPQEKMFGFLERKQQTDTFLKEENIADDFFLLNYETDKGMYKTNLVGTNSLKNKLKIIKCQTKDENTIKYDEESYEVNFTIHHILTGFTNKEEDNIYVLIEQIDTTPLFKLYSFDLNDKIPVELYETDMMPFFILNSDHERILIVRKGEDVNLLVNVPEHKGSFETRNFYISEQYFPDLTNDDIKEVPAHHTSAFLDIDGDGHPDIILDTRDSEKRTLKMFLTLSKKIVNYELSLKTSPIIWEDFNRDGTTDMCFLENDLQEGGSAVKIIYSNLDQRNIIPFDTTNRDNIIPLNNLGLRQASFNFDNQQIGLLDGLFSFDMKLSRFPAIICKIQERNKFRSIILSPDIPSEKTFSLFQKRQKKSDKIDYSLKYTKKIQHIENVVSVSCLDPYRTGREGLVLNYIEEGKFKLVFLENVLDVNNNKLSFLTLDNQNKAKKLKNKPLPGVSYKIKADDIALTNHSIISTSWLSLRKPLVTFGLGAINTLVDDVHIAIPFKKIFSLNRKIIPNSNLLMIYRDDKLEIELLLKYSFYIRIVFITLFFVLFINLLLLIFFIVKERKQERIKKRREAIAFNFKAL